LPSSFSFNFVFAVARFSLRSNSSFGAGGHDSIPPYPPSQGDAVQRQLVALENYLYFVISNEAGRQSFSLRSCEA
jgi:hypothetical protein